MDKLTDPISFKVSPRVKVLIQDKALEEGIDVSDLIRRWIFQALHASNFRMKDYLSQEDLSKR
jgi:hypothetical protein